MFTHFFIKTDNEYRLYDSNFEKFHSFDLSNTRDKLKFSSDNKTIIQINKNMDNNIISIFDINNLNTAVDIFSF